MVTPKEQGVLQLFAELVPAGAVAGMGERGKTAPDLYVAGGGGDDDLTAVE